MALRDTDVNANSVKPASSLAVAGAVNRSADEITNVLLCGLLAIASMDSAHGKSDETLLSYAPDHFDKGRGLVDALLNEREATIKMAREIYNTYLGVGIKVYNIDVEAVDAEEANSTEAMIALLAKLGVKL